MSEKPAEQRSYQIGDVGAGARVAQGADISWVEGLRTLESGDDLAQAFVELIQKVGSDRSLNPDLAALAQDKIIAVAEGMKKLQSSPTRLKLALVDARQALVGPLSWVGRALSNVLGSDLAQKTIGTVTEATTKAALMSLTD